MDLPSVRGQQLINKNIHHDIFMKRELEELHLLPALHQAIAQNDAKKVSKLLLSNSCDVNLKTEMGESPLYIASYFGNNEILDLLLNHHDIHVTKLPKAESEIHAAVRAGNLSVTKKLLDNGSSVNTTSLVDNWTPLHIACFNKDFPMVKLLLHYGANVNAVAHLGFAPISVAFLEFMAVPYKFAACTDLSLVLATLEALLSSSCVNVNHWSFSVGRENGPFSAANPLPLERAIRMLSPDLVRILLNHGARADGVYERSCMRVPVYKIYSLAEGNAVHILNTPHSIHAYQQCIELLLDHGIEQDAIVRIPRRLNSSKKPVSATKLRTAENIVKHLEPASKYLADYLQPTWFSVIDWLKDRQRSPLTLKNLSRHAIRRSVGHNIQSKAPKLPLPEILIKYILLYQV